MLPNNEQDLNIFSGTLLSAAITVHKEMGPGLLESVYQHCLYEELKQRGLRVDKMVPVQLATKDCP